MAIPPPGRFDADALQRARLAAGLSRPQLAERIGADPTIVKSWETRGVRPTVNNLTRVAEALHLAVDDLYHADGNSSGSLADLRVAAGLTQRELAQRLGVSQSSITRWERGRARPTSAEITHYAATLGVPHTAIADAIDTSTTPGPDAGTATTNRLRPDQQASQSLLAELIPAEDSASDHEPTDDDSTADRLLRLYAAATREQTDIDERLASDPELHLETTMKLAANVNERIQATVKAAALRAMHQNGNPGNWIASWSNTPAPPKKPT